jgi:predicted acyl esterase
MARGQATPLHVNFYPIAYQFAPGSRIGLILTHSDFPRIEPHPGVIVPPLSGAKPRTAQHTIFYGPTSKSRLTLPVLDL